MVVTGAGVAVTVTGGIVVCTRGPVRVGTAYGGSKRPNRPQALHGYAQELTCLGAAKMGLHDWGRVAIAVGSTVRGQSVPRSLRVSWRVMDPSAMVETSYKSRPRTQLVVEGPNGCPSELVPLAVGMSKYTDGDVKV